MSQQSTKQPDLSKGYDILVIGGQFERCDMDTAQIHIGIFISSLSIGEEIKNIAEQQKNVFHTSLKGLEEAIPVAQQMEKNGIEVIISRRGTAHLLRESLSIPVFSFPQSSLSVLTSIKRGVDMLSEQEDRRKRIVMPNFRTEVIGLDIIGDFLNIDFKQAVYYDRASLKQVVTTAVEDGADLLVGGINTMKFSEELGIKFQELINTRGDILETIENARSAALSNREQKATRYRYQSIMDLSLDGIISTDSNRRLVTINEKAKSILGIDTDDLLGTEISTIISNPKIIQALKNQTQIQEQIEEIGEELFVYNQMPLTMQNQVVGVVSSFKEIAGVMRTENKVRRSLTKGFVAKYHLHNLIHTSPAMAMVVNTSRELAKTDSTILVTGETGTGKEVIAQGIHNASRRRKMAFVSVNCGALPEQLLESELFGYEEGAFTGSKKGGKPGLFEISHQGTIFLDEIDSTSRSVQLRLLRVLQEKEVMRLGGDRKIPINVRVVAAAGKDLWMAVREGTFRKDLFFRLNVLRIPLPSLMQRKDDIPMLFKYFLGYHAKKNRIKPFKLPTSYMDNLCSYSWPGNVRQLKHFAEQLLLNSSLEASTRSLDVLFEELNKIVDVEFNQENAETQEQKLEQEPAHLRLADKTAEANIIRKAMTEVNYSRTRAAEVVDKQFFPDLLYLLLNLSLVF